MAATSCQMTTVLQNMQWSETMPLSRQPPYPHVINWQAELVSLNRAFHIVKNTWLMVYTDSKYAFHILLTHSVIWKELGFLNTECDLNNNSSYIYGLLRPSILSFPVTLIHYKAHHTAASNVNKDKNHTYVGSCQVILPSLMINPTSFQATLLYTQ